MLSFIDYEPFQMFYQLIKWLLFLLKSVLLPNQYFLKSIHVRVQYKMAAILAQISTSSNQFMSKSNLIHIVQLKKKVMPQ